MSTDLAFVTETPAAAALVAAVRAGDLDACRDILTAKDDRQMWALTTALAAMVTGPPDPERVLTYCCGPETRLTYSQEPSGWPMEVLQDALMVSRARTAPGARWVERGVAEWVRRREAVRAALAARHEHDDTAPVAS